MLVYSFLTAIKARVQSDGLINLFYVKQHVEQEWPSDVKKCLSKEMIKSCIWSTGWHSGDLDCISCLQSSWSLSILKQDLYTVCNCKMQKFIPLLSCLLQHYRQVIFTHEPTPGVGCGGQREGWPVSLSWIHTIVITLNPEQWELDEIICKDYFRLLLEFLCHLNNRWTENSSNRRGQVGQ